MNRSIKIYIFLLVVILGGIIYLDAVRPKPINWSPTYSLKDKIPFGLFVFDNESKELLKKNKIEKISKTIYEYLDPLYDSDSLVENYKIKGTIFSVSENYAIDNQSTDELFYFAAKGNSVFLSSKDFPQKLMDSLHFELGSTMELSDTVNVWFANKHLGNVNYKFNLGAGNTYFSKIDTLNTTVLGYQGNEKKKNINFIKIPYYKGYFYLNTQPIGFTNYTILKDNNSDYTQKVVSYIPKGKLLWFIKGQNGEIISDSPLRYILNQPALKWAWFLFLAGILTFMIFNAKRKQRVVPILKPLPNTTIDFTKTIGNLYYQEGDHQNIIDKKIIYFLEKIRNEYLIDTSILDDNFIKKLHQKTGENIQNIEKVVLLINNQRKNYVQSIEEDLIEINKAIEKVIN